MAPRVPRLLLLTQARTSPEVLVSLLPELVPAVDLVLLRWPEESAREVFQRARRLASVTPRPSLSVSDRFDVALAAGIEGVHLRESSLAPGLVRACAPALWVGASRHAGTVGTRDTGADYVTLSPLFATRSKPGAKPLGLHGLDAIELGGPWLGLGGIDAPRARAVAKAGAAGVAVSSAVWGSPDPVGAARAIRAAVEDGLSDRGAARSAGDLRDG